MPTQTNRPRPARDRWLTLGLLGLFAVGVFGVFTATGWEQSITQLRRISPQQLLALLSLSMINYIFRAIRWHLFASRIGLGLGLGTNILHFVAGFAMTITPGRIGELIRLRWIGRLTGRSLASIAPLPLVDRAFDLAGMGLILAGAVLIAQTEMSGALSVALLALGTAYVITRPRMLAWLIFQLHKIFGKRSREFGKARMAARSMSVFDHSRTVLPALALTLIGWLAEGVALFLLLNWLGADIMLSTAVAIFLFSLLAGGLTGAPGGLGGAEATMLFLLTMNGIPMEVAVPATVVIRVTSLWFAILVGALAFPFAERRARLPAPAV